MAYIIPTYTDSRSGAVYTSAYCKIASIDMNKTGKTAIVAIQLFDSQALRDAGNEPINVELPMPQFADTTDSPLFSSTFGVPPPTGDATPAPAVNGDDILWAQAYAGLKNHPDTQAMLANATAV